MWSKPAPPSDSGMAMPVRPSSAAFLKGGAREVAGFVEFFGERADFGFGEFADGFLEERLFFGQIEIHGWE